MIIEMIQSVLGYYGDKMLYGSIGWFGIIGFLTYACVIVAVTRLPWNMIISPLFRFHCISLVLSSLSAPVLAVMSSFILKVLLSETQSGLNFISVYMWFGLSMTFFSGCFLCAFLMSVSCNTFQRVLLFSNALLIMIGYFVIKGLYLI